MRVPSITGSGPAWPAHPAFCRAGRPGRNGGSSSGRPATAAGVEFLTEPRAEPYGRVAVFADIWGNRWDLLGPRKPQAFPA